MELENISIAAIVIPRSSPWQHPQVRKSVDIGGQLLLHMGICPHLCVFPSREGHGLEKKHFVAKNLLTFLNHLHCDVSIIVTRVV